jgi:hypothetical protein
MFTVEAKAKAAANTYEAFWLGVGVYFLIHPDEALGWMGYRGFG